MSSLDRNSVSGPAVSEAAPAGLATWHSRWLEFCLDRRYPSTFLRSLRSLSITRVLRYYGRSDSWGSGSSAPGFGQHERRSSHPQVSLSYGSDLPTPPSPTTLRPWTSISHATPHRVQSPAHTGLGFTFHSQVRRRWMAESSSLSYRWIVHLLLLPTPPYGRMQLQSVTGRRAYT